MNIVVAPDSFKGSISAAEAAAALAAGWRDERPHDAVTQVPIADGGEGTLAAFEAAFPGSRRHPVRVVGPDGRTVDTSWLALPDGRGVVELASTSGLTLMDRPRPLSAHTFGFGQAIDVALDAGVTGLELALGGSSSTDGGTGALRALGGRFLDAQGRSIPLGNGGLRLLARVDITRLRELPPTRLLCDVTNPLLGGSGAAAVFGPQKGADARQVADMEQNLEQLATLLSENPMSPGAGAAGGTAYGFLLAGARVVSGSRVVTEAIGLPDALAEADLVVTGEGHFDVQSAAGKGPSMVAELAARANVPVALVAGMVTAPTGDFRHACSLSDIAGSTAAAVADPKKWLRMAGTTLAGAFGHDRPDKADPCARGR